VSNLIQTVRNEGIWELFRGFLFSSMSTFISVPVLYRHIIPRIYFSDSDNWTEIRWPIYTVLWLIYGSVRLCFWLLSFMRGRR